MQTVSEINNALNELIAPLFPMKIKDFGDLHKAIQSAVNPFLEQFGMKYGVWWVRMEGELAYKPIDCFGLNEDFTKDKRCASHNRFGTMNRAWFSASSPEFETELTHEQAKQTIETGRLADRIAEQEVNIVRIQDDLDAQKLHLSEMKSAYKNRLTA